MKTLILEPEVINSIGLLLDIIGFILISLAIIREKKPIEDETLTLKSAFGETIAEDLITIKYLRSSKSAKIGFWLIIIGFLFQIGGNLISLNS